MTVMQGKNLGSPDEIRTFPKGRVEIVQVGHFTIAREELEPGWRWSEHVKPIANTTSCQVMHNGYLVSGRLHIRLDDGTEAEFGPGDVYVIPAGHDGWVVGDEPAVGFEFDGAAEFAKPG